MFKEHIVSGANLTPSISWFSGVLLLAQNGAAADEVRQRATSREVSMECLAQAESVALDYGDRQDGSQRALLHLWLKRVMVHFS
jgi:hypothetical protein